MPYQSQIKWQNSCSISQPKKYVCHLFIQELGKFNFKINVIPKGAEKYMSSTIYKMVEIWEQYALELIAINWS